MYNWGGRQHNLYGSCLILNYYCRLSRYALMTNDPEFGLRGHNCRDTQSRSDGYRTRDSFVCWVSRMLLQTRVRCARCMEVVLHSHNLGVCLFDIFCMHLLYCLLFHVIVGDSNLIKLCHGFFESLDDSVINDTN
jgi:hypothetical protein